MKKTALQFPSDLHDPGALGGCVYYAQNREDLVLLSFFPNEEKGFYVDVGAFEPDLDSVTKLFYLKGWCGINIEPQVERYEEFQQQRPRDINVNMGVASQSGELTLRAYGSGGLSTFSDSMKQDYELHPSNDTKDFTESTVPVGPLRTIFSENKVTKISFMKVDVEGFEYEVLESNDWTKYRPEVLCIESNHMLKDWRPLLRKAAYMLVFNDGLNDYYVDSRTDRAAKFDFIEEVVHHRGGGIRFEHYDQLVKWAAYGRDKTMHVQELIAEKESLLAEVKSQELRWASLSETARRAVFLLKASLTGGRK